MPYNSTEAERKYFREYARRRNRAIRDGTWGPRRKTIIDWSDDEAVKAYRRKKARECHKPHKGMPEYAVWGQIPCLYCGKPMSEGFKEVPFGWWKRKRHPKCQKKYDAERQKRLRANYKSERELLNKQTPLGGDKPPKKRWSDFPKWLGINKTVLNCRDIQDASPEKLTRLFEQGFNYTIATR